MPHNPIVPRKIDKRSALGEFKLVGSTDPDILHAEKNKMLTPSKAGIVYSLMAIFVALALAITILGLGVTVVLLPMGVFGLIRSLSNIRAINTAYNEIASST